MKIGLLDWGIGGLSVYQQLKQQRTSLDCVYFSDAGAMPYGRQSSKDLLARLNLVTDFFRKHNIFYIVIACNAASTVIEDLKTLNPDMQFFGMLDSGTELIEKSQGKKGLVVGGYKTIRSKYFQNHFAKLKIQIEAKVAQPWSDFIERGETNSVAFRKSLKKVLSNLKAKPDFVLLACTHYPAITKQIQNLLPEARILDPALTVVLKIPKISSSKNQTKFFTTGSVDKMKSSAKKAFGIKINSVQKIKL